jgi:hypothetical protein
MITGEKQMTRSVNSMTRAQLRKEYDQNSKRQGVLTDKLIELGYGRVLRFELHTLDVPEAQEQSALMGRLSTIAMELDSIQLGYRGASLTR